MIQNKTKGKNDTFCGFLQRFIDDQEIANNIISSSRLHQGCEWINNDLILKGNRWSPKTELRLQIKSNLKLGSFPIHEVFSKNIKK